MNSSACLGLRGEEGNDGPQYIILQQGTDINGTTTGIFFRQEKTDTQNAIIQFVIGTQNNEGDSFVFSSNELEIFT